MKIIVYTANINNYDSRKISDSVNKDIDFLYYSNDESKIDGWHVMLADMDIDDDPVKVSRYYKTHSHLLPAHDYSIWIDASFQMRPLQVFPWIKKTLMDKDIACYYHGEDDPDRSCIYKEAIVCINPSQETIILNQMGRYKKEGFPEKFGLRSNGIIIRRNNDNVKRFNELWWEEIKRGSHRDQLSQMYTSWKTGIEIGKIDEGSVYVNELARHHRHLKRKNKI